MMAYSGPSSAGVQIRTARFRVDAAIVYTHSTASRHELMAT